MDRKILAIIVLLLSLAACFSHSYKVQNTTITVTKTISSTFTTTMYFTVTSNETVTTTKISKIFVTVTKTVQPQSSTTQQTFAQSSDLYNSVTIGFWDTTMVSFSNGTYVIAIPSRYSLVTDFLYAVYRVMNSSYYSKFLSEYNEQGIPPLPTGSAYSNYVQPGLYYSMFFHYDYGRASVVNAAYSSYEPLQLLSLRSGVCGDYAVFYAVWYLAHSIPVTVHLITFDSYANGHVWLYNGYEALEDQFMGIDTDYLSAYWYTASGPYMEYIVTIYPNGSLRLSYTHVTNPPTLPMPIITDSLTYSGTATMIYGSQSLPYTFYGNFDLNAFTGTMVISTTTIIYSNGTDTYIIGSNTQFVPGTFGDVLPLFPIYEDVDVFTHTGVTITRNGYLYGQADITMYEVVSGSVVINTIYVGTDTTIVQTITYKE